MLVSIPCKSAGWIILGACLDRFMGCLSAAIQDSLFSLANKLTAPSYCTPFPLHPSFLRVYAGLQIDPNVSRVEVPDDRFDHLVEQHKPKSIVPAVLTVTDIAGLVKGAAEGAGLGNAFLSHIAAVDGIFHVCRAFDQEDIIHVEGSVDPCRDLDIIHSELIKKDLAAVSSLVEGKRKLVERKVGGKEAAEEFAALDKVLKQLQANKEVRFGDWSPLEIEVINGLNLLTAKPMTYLVNLSEKSYINKSNKWLPKLADWLKARGTDDKMIPISCEFEQKVRLGGLLR
jgi:obg-like ATPase 1